MMKKSKKFVAGIVCLSTALFCSCGGFLEVQPRAFLNKVNVYRSDATAESAVIGLYANIALTGFASGNESSLSFLSSLSSDELENYSTASNFDLYRQFNENVLVPGNAQVASLWSQPYQLIYGANAVLEGVTDNNSLSTALRYRLRGEALFLRAFAHFYLVNLFGACPLAVTTDYRTNAMLPKSDIPSIYQQIISDLEEAQVLLPADYSFARNERIRANKWVAKALLARVYLYQNDWQRAEAQASDVIAREDLFTLENDLDSVFLKTSREAIWQIVPRSGDNEVNANEGRIFSFSGKPSRAALRETLVTSMEAGDSRMLHWIGNTTDVGTVYYYPAKYKGLTTAPVVEYSMVLRLAELYLIRAEARVQQQELDLAVVDLDRIRKRAHLPLLSETRPSLSAEELLKKINKERRVELFTEWGHRWFDLKRTGKADEVLGTLKPTWRPTATLYPIPESQLLNDPAMTDGQNPGYLLNAN